MQTRRILLGALAAPVLLLPACGGHDSVADPPVSSAPTSSDPTDPPKQESPEHFIRRWTRAEARMENTGDVAPYLAISKGCTACSKLAKEVHGFYAAGGSVEWDGWTIKSIERSRRQGNSLTFTVRIDSAPTTYTENSSGLPKHLIGGPSTELLTIRRDGANWQMIDTVEQAS